MIFGQRTKRFDLQVLTGVERFELQVLSRGTVRVAGVKQGSTVRPVGAKTGKDIAKYTEFVSLKVHMNFHSLHEVKRWRI